MGHLSSCFLTDQHWAMTFGIENVRVAKVHKPTVQSGALLHSHISVSPTYLTPLNAKRWKGHGLLQSWVRNSLHTMSRKFKALSRCQQLHVHPFPPFSTGLSSSTREVLPRDWGVSCSMAVHSAWDLHLALLMTTGGREETQAVLCANGQPLAARRATAFDSGKKFPEWPLSSHLHVTWTVYPLGKYSF